MQARLVFTTATAVSPDILIVDEILGAGDGYFAGKSRDRMRALVALGRNQEAERSLEEALELAVTLSDRYITDRFLPDKAIDVMDEAGARVHLSNIRVPEVILKLEEEIEEIEVSTISTPASLAASAKRAYPMCSTGLA